MTRLLAVASLLLLNAYFSPLLLVEAAAPVPIPPETEPPTTVAPVFTPAPVPITPAPVVTPAPVTAAPSTSAPNTSDSEPAPETSPAEDFVAAVPGWTEEELKCLNDMEEADSTYMHRLNHHEYFVFADLMANRIFGMVNALDENNEWELQELYDDLLLEGPGDDMSGIDIFGSGFGMLERIGSDQETYLKTVCSKTKDQLQKIGPDHA